MLYLASTTKKGCDGEAQSWREAGGIYSMCAEGHMFITHGRSVAAGQHINMIRTSGQRARVTNDCSSGGRDDISRRNSKDITLSHRLSHTLSTLTFPSRGSVCVISGCTSITISTNSAFCSAISPRHKQGCNKCLSISNAWDEKLDLWSLRWRTIWMIDLYSIQLTSCLCVKLLHWKKGQRLVNIPYMLRDISW